jgi:hypothetical protein
MLTERENWLRAIEFRTPEWIPCSVGFSLRTWHQHRERLEEIALRHPRLVPSYPKKEEWDDFPPVYREGEHFRDNWGCLWYNSLGGLEGQVVESPIADYAALDSYVPPDWRTMRERGPMDWDEYTRAVKAAPAAGRLAWVDGQRLFDRLYFLRGFENLMIDIATDDPRLPRLVDMLWRHERSLVLAGLELKPDVISFHTDIGTQNGLMISPEKFRRYIKPMFKDLFQTIRKGGAHVVLSSDGRLLEIVDDLIECGISMHDPQLRANTLEGIAKHYKGKVCVNLDLDRQSFAFSTPKEIRAMVGDGVKRLSSPQGGLMVQGSVYDEVTPLENIEALCQALEEHCLKM